MNLSAFLASLGAAILARLSSVGASVAASFGAIVMAFTADQRTVLADAKKMFTDTLNAGLAASKSEVNAIEDAATATFQVFCSDEKKFFGVEVSATIILMESAAKTAANIVGTVITGGAPAAA